MVGLGKFEAGPGEPPKLGDCASCRNKTDNAPTCLAFPNGIPRAILDAEVRHTIPYPGDNGVQYAPDDEKLADLRAVGWL